MTVLSDYLKTTQGFIRDRAQKNVNPDDLIHYVNRARREIALRTQCIRILTPISGQISSIQVTNAGSGYSANPTISITSPDSPGGMKVNPAGAQAVASAQVIGGKIAGISVSYGGDGYFQPQVTITDTTGTGATAVATVTPISVTQGSQEVYLFKDVPLFMFPGVGEIFNVHSVSFIFANYRYSLPCYPFSIYQAMIRQYPRQYTYVPSMAAQFGQGSNGSLYFYPIPSTFYQFELDAFCLPQELIDDGTFEAIAKPWDDAVAIGATVYAFEEMQSLNNARYYQEKFDAYVHKYSAWTRGGRATNLYGRW